MTANQQRAEEIIYETLGYLCHSDDPSNIVQALADKNLLILDPHKGDWTAVSNGCVTFQYAVDEAHLSPADACEIAYSLLASADEAEN